MLFVLCRSKSCTCSYSRQKLIASSWDKSSSRREKLGRAWRVLLKICKPSLPCRPTATILETPWTQTQTHTDRPHSTPMDPKVAHSKREKKTQYKGAWLRTLLHLLLGKRNSAKCKVSFVEEKSVIYNMIWYDINIIMTMYEFYEMNWKVAWCLSML